MFSVVYGLLLRPLPYRDADRLLVVDRRQDFAGAERPRPLGFTAPSDRDTWQRGFSAFSDIAFFNDEQGTLLGPDGREYIYVSDVSGAFFSTVEGRLAAGRWLGPGDDQNSAVVVSLRLATRLFGGAAPAIGKSVTVGSHPYEVIGVADGQFALPSPETDVWLPAGTAHALNANCCTLQMMGRLAASRVAATAAAEATALAVAQSAANGANRHDIHANVVTLRDREASKVRPVLLVLLTAVALLLVVACVNVMNLLMTRQLGLAREVAIRVAIGASTTRLALAAVVESAALAGMGTMLGVGFAKALVSAVAASAVTQVPQWQHVRFDWPVLLFAAAVAAVVTVAMTVVPHLRASRRDPTLALKGSSLAPGGTRSRRWLCVAELSASVVLLVGAGLLGRSLVRLLHADLGVTTDHVVTASITLSTPAGHASDEDVNARLGVIVSRVAAVPGITAVGLGTSVPPDHGRMQISMRNDGDAKDYMASLVVATPGYFDALGMRLVAGRGFTLADDANHPAVMIMNESTAHRFFGAGDPLGKRMRVPGRRNGASTFAEATLVGVVANVKYSGLASAAEDAVYRPLAQQSWQAPFLVARSAIEPAALVDTVRRAIVAADPNDVVSDARTLDDRVSTAAAEPRLRAVLLGGFACVTVLMAVVGLYGVVSHAVTLRTREFGVRMALGADRIRVLRLVLADSAITAAVGVACGLGIALLLGRIVTSVLYGIAPTDPVSFVVAGVGLFLCAMGASVAPAWRATRVDPMVALREE
jgi:putative ABC transport system permease protein